MLAAWVEQGNKLACLRITSVSTNAFVEITPRAGKPKVVLCCSATSCQWYEVFDLKRHPNDGFLRLAVPTTVCSLNGNTIANFRSNCACAHDGAKTAGSLKL